jgi:hypothetical protein
MFEVIFFHLIDMFFVQLLKKATKGVILSKAISSIIDGLSIAPVLKYRVYKKLTVGNLH